VITARIDLERCAPAAHGGAAHDPRIRLDFSSNINAWGPATHILRALMRADPAAYPDPQAREACRAAAQCWKLSSKTIGFFPGASDAIHRVARAFLSAGDVAVIAAPAFAEYARAAHAAAARCIEVRSETSVADAGLEYVQQAALQHGARLVFVASPSSPFGTVHGRRELMQLVDGTDALIILDESYRSFAAGRFAAPAFPTHERVLHIRSITKDFALAGLRAAFVTGEPGMLAALEAAGPPWATSSMAQRAAVAALQVGGRAWLTRTLRKVKAARSQLVDALSALPLHVHPSRTNYICITTQRASHIYHELLEAGIALRHCGTFGLPNTLRLAVRLPAENQKLVRELRRVTC
jgi:histidinol-phosphate aminotransferase